MSLETNILIATLPKKILVTFRSEKTSEGTVLLVVMALIDILLVCVSVVNAENKDAVLIDTTFEGGLGQVKSFLKKRPISRELGQFGKAKHGSVIIAQTMEFGVNSHWKIVTVPLSGCWWSMVKVFHWEDTSDLPRRLRRLWPKNPLPKSGFTAAGKAGPKPGPSES